MAVTQGQSLESSNKQIDKTYSTQGHKKLWLYFLDLLNSDYVKNKISVWRTKYQIPAQGFVDEQQTIPPLNWLHSHTDKQTELLKEIDLVCKKYKLAILDWGDAFQYYLFYGTFNFPYFTDAHNLCRVQDISEIREEKLKGHITNDDDVNYPIAIRVSPYATQRDIVDYVKKMYSVISEYQSKYKSPDSKIGKIKIKKVQERDEFIYQNRNLPGKKIATLVQNKFGGRLLPYSYIHKIKSREKKKRQQV